MRLMPLFASVLLALCLNSRPAAAQTWPSRPIRVIVPYAAGGATDVFARLVAGKLQEQLGAPVVVENRAGAGGNIGADAVAKAAPDGYTLLLNINGHAIAPAIYKSLPFDPDKDFIPVTQMVSTATAVVVQPGLPVKNFQEFVALAKSRPGALNYGSTGIGNSLHLTMELLMRDTGIKMEMVPFRGDAPLFQAFMSGDVHAAVVPTSGAKPHLDSGVVRALGVTSARRVAAMPDIPTLVEQGLPEFVVSGWIGLFAPAGVPRPIIERLAREVRTAIMAPDMAPRLFSFGLEPAVEGPEAFGERYRADRIKFQRIVKEANIALQD
jgi:tripartite-type tricarboxylate transporter receptor subunit TctC